MTNSANPDQLVSEEANRSGSSLLAKADLSGFSRTGANTIKPVITEYNYFFFLFFLICFSYLLRTGLFHCEQHNTSGLIVEKVLTLLLQFWRQMVVQRLGESNQML